VSEKSKSISRDEFIEKFFHGSDEDFYFYINESLSDQELFDTGSVTLTLVDEESETYKKIVLKLSFEHE
jgi:hypothetical protein